MDTENYDALVTRLNRAVRSARDLTTKNGIVNGLRLFVIDAEKRARGQPTPLTNYPLDCSPVSADPNKPKKAKRRFGSQYGGQGGNLTVEEIQQAVCFAIADYLRGETSDGGREISEFIASAVHGPLKASAIMLARLVGERISRLENKLLNGKTAPCVEVGQESSMYGQEEIGERTIRKRGPGFATYIETLDTDERACVEYALNEFSVDQLRQIMRERLANDNMTRKELCGLLGYSEGSLTSSLVKMKQTGNPSAAVAKAIRYLISGRV